MTHLAAQELWTMPSKIKEQNLKLIYLFRYLGDLYETYAVSRNSALQYCIKFSAEKRHKRRVIIMYSFL